MNIFRSNQFRFYFLIVICSVFFSVKIYRNTQIPVSGWDVFGYYLYLPQSVIHHDLKIKNIDHLNEIYEKYKLSGTLYQVNKLENGNHAIKYTAGWAILNFPFYISGHLVAKAGGYPIDGFSSPYQWSIVVGCIFYLILGLYFSAKILFRFFDEKTAAWTFLLLVFGTNYYFIVTDAFIMPHLHLFTLYAAFILITDNWHKDKSYLNSVLMGGVLALMTLIRPTEILAALIPLLWGVISLKDLKKRFLQIFTVDFLKMITIVVAFVFTCLPQLLYWKMVTGHFVYNGYDNAGEGFEFLHSNLMNVLFSFRKGWFIYTPLALFFVAGFFFMKKHPAKIGLLLFYVINIYIISCWTNWWYAQSFSQRPMMHSLPVLLIPFGLLIKFLIEKKQYYFFGIFIFLVFLNLFQTWQANVGIIDGSRMTFAYYKKVFLKTYIPEGADKLLLVDRSEYGENNFNPKDYHMTERVIEDFEGRKAKNISRENSYKGNKSWVMTAEEPFSFAFNKEFAAITSQDHAWMKVSVWIYLEDAVAVLLPTLVTTFEHNNEVYMYKVLSFESDTSRYYPVKEWFYVETYYLTPEIRRKNDNFKAYLWMKGMGRIWVDNMKLEIFEHN